MFEATGSVALLLAVAVTVAEPGLAAVALTVIVAVAPGARALSAQVIEPDPAQLPTVDETVPGVKPGLS